jgi:ABC-2 type transport system ATP-binding protein
MRLVAGLLKPGSGSIRVFGRDPVSEAAGLRGIIGYMPQKSGLYEDLSVIENLTLQADLRAVVGGERDEIFARILKFTDLSRFTSRLAGKLSGGMKQKLGLACALLGAPRLLLLDEPGVGVDPISRRELWRMVGELATEGIAIIWSTAYLDEAERCADVLLLNDGKQLYAGPPADLTRRMDGRCFLLSVPAEIRREKLTELAALPQILDATIQAQNIRLLARKDNALPSSCITQFEIKPASPRFEDAFMDILGGVQSGNSSLARILRDIPRDNATVIEARELTRTFGNFTAADHINLKIERGEIYGLLGPNGAGKSTIFRMLCGLLAPTGGEARAAGIDLRRSPARARQRIGYMAQKFSLYGQLTVAQNLAFFSGAYGLHGAAQREAIGAVTDCFHLAQYHGLKADALPLGCKQRLALACAVMHSPEILFLDEPTSGTDPVTRREFWSHINAAVRRGVTVMVTTHFMDEAEYCDRVGLVNRSKLIAAGTPEELKAQAITAGNRHPTMEDAFIALVGRSEQ